MARRASPNTLWRDGFDAARGEAGFAKLLAETAGSVEAALGFFGNLKTDRGRIDLKKAGLFGIVTAARALAIFTMSSNVRRLRGSMASVRSGSEASATSRHSTRRMRPSSISFCINRSTTSNADGRRPILSPSKACCGTIANGCTLLSKPSGRLLR